MPRFDFTVEVPCTLLGVGFGTIEAATKEEAEERLLDMTAEEVSALCHDFKNEQVDVANEGFTLTELEEVE